MSEFEVKQAFQTPDGKTFESRKEAQDHLRRPKIKEAMLIVTEGNNELADWIIDNANDLDNAFNVATIKRVTKSDRTKYEKALYHAESLGDAKLQFLVDNKQMLIDGLRWPSVKRMEDSEKDSAVKAELLAMTEENEEVSDFLIEKRDTIFLALDAGKVKKEVNPKAAEGLARWREEQAKLKAEKAPEEKAPAKKK